MTAEPRAERVVGVEPCAGCLYQVQKRQRRATTVAGAEYRCNHCGRPLCREHIRYDAGTAWWLCAVCIKTLDRIREHRNRQGGA